MQLNDFYDSAEYIKHMSSDCNAQKHNQKGFLGIGEPYDLFSILSMIFLLS
jgi:hypothetical protein